MSNVIDFNAAKAPTNDESRHPARSVDENEVQIAWRVAADLRASILAGDSQETRLNKEELAVIAKYTRNPVLRRLCLSLCA